MDRSTLETVLFQSGSRTYSSRHTQGSRVTHRNKSFEGPAIPFSSPKQIAVSMYVVQCTRSPPYTRTEKMLTTSALSVTRRERGGKVTESVNCNEARTRQRSDRYRFLPYTAENPYRCGLRASFHTNQPGTLGERVCPGTATPGAV